VKEGRTTHWRKRLARTDGHPGNDADGDVGTNRVEDAGVTQRRDRLASADDLLENEADVANAPDPLERRAPLTFDELVGCLQLMDANGVGSAASDDLSSSLAAAYARNSDPRHQDTLEAQIEACRAYAASVGITVPDAYVFAEGRSGLDVGRPEYHKLLNLAKTKRIKHVIIFVYDRFGRDSGTFIQDMRELERLGITVHTHAGKIAPEAVPWLAMNAEMTSRTLSAHVANQQRSLVLRGHILGRLPYGYRQRDDRTWEIIPEKAEIVAEMFRRVARGESVHAVASWFGTKVGYRVAPSVIIQRVGHPIYLGIYRFRHRRVGRFTRSLTDEPPLYYSMPHLGIVAPELWLSANRIRRKQPQGAYHRSEGPRTVLQGMLYCARCTRVWRRTPDIGKTVSVRLMVKGDRSWQGFWCPECGGRCPQSHILPNIEQGLFAIPVGPYVARTLAQSPAKPNESIKRLRALRQLLEQAQKARDDLVRVSLDRSNETVRLFSIEDIARTKRRMDGEIASLERQILDGDAESESGNQLRRSFAWLEDPDIWVTYPTYPIADKNELLSRCIMSCHIDFVLNEGTIQWYPAVARLLGTESTTFRLMPRVYLPYADLKVMVRGLRLTCIREYKDAVRSGKLKDDGHKRVPLQPELAYAAEWEGWRTFLGIGFLPYVEARAFAQTLGLSTLKQYREWATGKTVLERHGLPTNPQVIYRGEWQGLHAFLTPSPTHSCDTSA